MAQRSAGSIKTGIKKLPFKSIYVPEFRMKEEHI